MKACYENNCTIDLYTKHLIYDVTQMIHDEVHDKECVSEQEYGVGVNVNIPKLTTDDHGLTN